jgi:hypothetical protein
MKHYTCVHVKKGTIEVEASSSYGAAQEAARRWKLKSTSGIDAYLHTKEGQTL